MTEPAKPDPGVIVQALRDFQRATVNYAFRRLYCDSDRVDRFLFGSSIPLATSSASSAPPPRELLLARRRMCSS